MIVVHTVEKDPGSHTAEDAKREYRRMLDAGDVTPEEVRKRLDLTEHIRGRDPQDLQADIDGAKAAIEEFEAPRRIRLTKTQKRATLLLHLVEAFVELHESGYESDGPTALVLVRTAESVIKDCEDEIPF